MRYSLGMQSALFGTHTKSTMREWLKGPCKEAGVRYHVHKELGRHAFVTKELQNGRSLKWVQDAGRWQTMKVVAEKYGHLELQQIDEQA
jgi:site-specific recombinase XerD